jgi:putative transposase
MKRKRYGAELKARVALEAIRGLKTINEIASEYEVHPNLIGKWKRQVLESLPGIFPDKQTKGGPEETGKIDQLYQQIGQLQVELSWLKKGRIYLVRRNGLWWSRFILRFRLRGSVSWWGLVGRVSTFGRRERVP